jgi:hypothetical protein
VKSQRSHLTRTFGGCHVSFPMRQLVPWNGLPRSSRTALAALGIFAFAFALRVAWVAFVDSPFDNIYSDMRGYVDRARRLAYGEADPFPMFATLYPPGAHLMYAAQMRLVGWSHHAAYLAVNCLWGAVVAPCGMLLALRIVPRLPVAICFGLITASWYPLLAFSAYFSSEQLFAGLVALSAWLLVRHIETGKGAIVLGVASSLAYLVRPQIVLTLAALAVAGLVVLWRQPRRAPRLRVRRLLVAGAILTTTVAWGAFRYHGLSGRWGLVSDNSAMTRLWADTDYGSVRAAWQAPDGIRTEFHFDSPPKMEIGERRELVFVGYIGDPVELDRARRTETAHMTLGERVARWVSNVRLLFVDNALWPPSDHLGTGWKRSWSDASKYVLLVMICPLAFVGILSCVRRPTVNLLVCSAHVGTALFVAAFFFAEARYRVPYDVVLLLLALEGARWSTLRLGQWLAATSGNRREP